MMHKKRHFRCIKKRSPHCGTIKTSTMMKNKTLFSMIIFQWNGDMNSNEVIRFRILRLFGYLLFMHIHNGSTQLQKFMVKVWTSIFKKPAIGFWELKS